MSRRFRHRPFAAPSSLMLLLLLLLALVRLLNRAESPAAPETLLEGTYEVQRVVDGDTLLLTNAARVRLIGVDTPETKKPDHPVEPWGPEATEFTERFIGSHPVELRLDRERLDRHGRFLAYVYVDGEMLNEALIRAGLGHAEMQFNYSDSMKARFRKAETEARDAQRGLWSAAESSRTRPPAEPSLETRPRR